MTEHLSHDLPDYVPNVPARRAPERAKVYKNGLYWTWRHTCVRRPPGAVSMGHPFGAHATALRFALDHMKRCL